MNTTSMPRQPPTGRRTPPRLAAALAAAARGWPVIPCYPYSKFPVPDDWDTVATTDPAQIADWWAAAPYNIAISCRAAGLIVIDLDPAHGQEPPDEWAHRGVTHGRDVLRLLALEAGEPDPLDTYRVRTPSGGEHRYFHAPTDVELRNTVGRLGWHIDTRGRGGNIIAAGSIRRVDGGRRLYRPVHPIRPVATLPSWLAAALTPPARPAHPRTRAGIIVPARRVAAYAAGAVKGETAAVQAAQVGTRANRLFIAAIKLGQIVGAGWLDEREAIHALLVAAHQHNGVEGWTSEEALHHIENGLARGIHEPRDLLDAA
ncbi:hypothetical protein Lesp02_03140 [Lentzea sp. NBRC 105346]|uniref:bifunctional DNA primase/polymerase n=1 Tax=Lentzea sp. NBRC 105346 TaxID=3032205 RepID=UPI0024A4A6A5|nr:bifunctional DNA primase/polymerase [Lentzea sp. NBRC 105346]GLZ28124.1 hypothetical protein Lesp02_03140 [Lentzea sp. NBRC 105346]